MSQPNQFLRVLLEVAYVWITISFLLSIIGGWFSLSRRYKSPRTYYEDRYSFQSAAFRYVVSYNRCLTIGGDEQGLHMSVMLPFRLFHPPIYIPWNDITKGKRESRLFGIRLRFRKTPSVPIALTSFIVQQLEAIKGSEFPQNP